MDSRRSAKRDLPVLVHPTFAGWLFLGISAFVGVGAVKTQAALTFVVFGAMLGAMCVSALIAWRMVSRATLERDLPDRVWQNQTAYLSYYLRNKRRRGSCLGLQVEELGLKNVDFAAGYCLHLESGSVFRAGARFAARRRGRTLLRRIRLSTTFPFGLVRASRSFLRQAAVVVWPARGRLKRQLLHHGAAETSSADPAPVQGGQDEFFGLRDYRSGDNPRWIHWRRSAMRRKPVVREMSRPVPEILWVVLDTHSPDLPGSAHGRRERMFRAAATIIDHAFSRGYKVGLAMAYQDRLAVHEPAPGLGQRCKLLDALAEFTGNTGRELQETLGAVQHRSLRDAQVIVIARDQSQLSRMALGPMRLACRNLLVVQEGQLGSIFEDDPLAEKEQAHAAEKL